MESHHQHQIELAFSLPEESLWIQSDIRCTSLLCRCRGTSSSPCWRYTAGSRSRCRCSRTPANITQCVTRYTKHHNIFPNSARIITNTIGMESRESRESLPSHQRSLRGPGWGGGPSHLKVLVSEPSGRRVCVGFFSLAMTMLLAFDLCSEGGLFLAVTQTKTTATWFLGSNSPFDARSWGRDRANTVVHCKRSSLRGTTKPHRCSIIETPQGRRPWSSRCGPRPGHVQHQRTTELCLFGLSGNNALLLSCWGQPVINTSSDLGLTCV